MAQPVKRKKRKDPLWLRVLPSVSFVLFILLWEAIVRLRGIAPIILPAPSAIATYLWVMIRDGSIPYHLGITFLRIMGGFFVASFFGILLGVTMGMSRVISRVLDPWIAALYPLPKISLIPLLIIWLGLDEEPKIAVIFLGTFFFNTLMTADVVRGVPVALIDVSYTLGARTGDILRKVIIPHSLPGMIDAVRVNAAAAWSFVVVAELIAAQSGLGYRINRLSRLTQVDRIFAVLVVIGVIGLAIDIALRILRDRIGRWL